MPCHPAESCFSLSRCSVSNKSLSLSLPTLRVGKSVSPNICMLACLLLSFYLLQHQSLLLYQRSDDYHSTLLTICFFHFLSPLRCHVNRRSFFHPNIPLTSIQHPQPSTPLVVVVLTIRLFNFTNTFLLSLPLSFQVPCQPAVTFHPNILLTFQSNTFNHQPLLF